MNGNGKDMLTCFAKTASPFQFGTVKQKRLALGACDFDFDINGFVYLRRFRLSA